VAATARTAKQGSPVGHSRACRQECRSHATSEGGSSSSRQTAQKRAGVGGLGVMMLAGLAGRSSASSRCDGAAAAGLQSLWRGCCWWRLQPIQPRGAAWLAAAGHAGRSAGHALLISTLGVVLLVERLTAHSLAAGGACLMWGQE
jgi:hypothetical protein